MGIWDLFKGMGKRAGKLDQAKAQGPITVYDEPRELNLSGFVSTRHGNPTDPF
jgi:hypothetical protein